MVNKIHIKNFKSVYDLELELGRFNVFIGENESGKSNILEAIALGSAASANLLANEFLASRGIRVTEANLMFSAFSKKIKQVVELSFNINEAKYNYKLAYRKQGKMFEDQSRSNVIQSTQNILHNLFNQNGKIFPDETNILGDKDLYTYLELLNIMPGIDKKKGKQEIENSVIERTLKENFSNDFLIPYLIFTPENNSLRNFFSEKQISPLGLSGEGLFKELKRISLKKSKKQFTELNKYLSELIDWFEKFELPANGFPGEQYLKIRDKYLTESIEFIDQRSANEGFLFLLFFLTLFISEDTPTFFALDNIENSFNPKLCSKLAEILVILSKEHSKQALITTHNPFILDGLDLSDDEQRLFVVRRNLDGHTIATRVKPDKPLSYKLSEAWMNGYIGGLPNNF